MNEPTKFDPSKDKKLWSDVTTEGKYIFEVAIYQYGDGEKKIQIGRRFNNDLVDASQYNDSFLKLGRLTFAECKKVMVLMAKACRVLEDETQSETPYEDI